MLYRVFNLHSGRKLRCIDESRRLRRIGDALPKRLHNLVLHLVAIRRLMRRDHLGDQRVRVTEHQRTGAVLRIELPILGKELLLEVRDIRRHNKSRIDALHCRLEPLVVQWVLSHVLILPH